MRRLVVVLLCLGICLSVPAGAQAANNQRRVKTTGQRTKPRRAPVTPLRTRAPRRSIGETRTASVDQEYEEMMAQRESAPAEYEEEQEERPIRMGRSMRNSHRPDGSFRPTAPGYGEFERLVGGKAARYGKVATVVTTAAAIVITALAVTAIGIPLMHNIPIFWAP